MIVHFTSLPREDWEVMRDQFEYLMEHNQTHCRADCLECARIHELAMILKWPFRKDSVKSTSYHNRKVKHAA